MNFQELIDQLKVNKAVEHKISSLYNEQWQVENEEMLTKDKVSFSYAMKMMHEAAEDAYQNAINLIEEWYMNASQESPFD